MNKRKWLEKIISVPYLWITMLILVLLTATTLSYRSIDRNNKLIYLAQANQAYEKRILSTIDWYETFSEYLYNKMIDDVVLNMMYQASQGDSVTRDLNRTALYQYLLDDYELIASYDYRQLHFHLPTGDSFLRFHAPNTYGDNLMEGRDSIRIVNTELIYLSGFEEGRIYNGYRFVYPLFYNDVHVGSVEISISIATLLEILYTVEPNSAYFFIIKSDVVEALVFDEYLENYFNSSISDSYLYDRLIYDQFNERRNFLIGDQMETFYQKINPRIIEKLQLEESFSYVIRYKGVYYTTQFLNIDNIGDEHVAYVISTYQDDGYRNITSQNTVVYVTIIIFFSVSYLALFIYIKDKNRILDLSKTDQLTGLYNRLHFNQLAAKEIQRTQRYQHDLSLVIMDIDFFKKINDTYGHLTGDEVLKEVSSLVQKHLRRFDVLSRWGGEEFALLLPETDLLGAVKVAEKIQLLVREYVFNQSISLTLSFGIATYQEGMKEVEDLILIADRHLYTAKNTGRDKIVFK